MKLTHNTFHDSTRSAAKSVKPSSSETPTRKAESAKRTAQAADPSKTALAILKRQNAAREKRILEFASGNGSKGTVNRSVGALHRLRVSEEALAAAPAITPLLEQADGGLKQVMAAMRFAPDDVITAFLRKYDTLPVGDRERLPIEAIALAAGVDTNHLLGSIMLALQAQSVNMVKIIAMSAHPAITKARVKYGQMAGGDKDRAALDTAMGFLPSPKAPTFIGKAIFGSGRNSMQRHDDLPGDEDEEPPIAAVESNPDLDKLFPPANLMQEKLTAIRQRPRQLPGTPEVVGRH
jgi:hypothetical protein